MLTLEQWDNIRPSLEDMNFRMKQHLQGLNRARIRLKKLRDNGMFIESAMIDGQILEYMIRLQLRAYKTKSAVLYELAMDDPFAEIVESISESVEKEPLGALIGKLKRFVGECPLTEKLDYFNKRFRKDFVHHAFFGGEEKMQESDQEYEKYMRGDQYKILIQEMSNLMGAVKDETVALYERAMGLRPSGKSDEQ